MSDDDDLDDDFSSFGQPAAPLGAGGAKADAGAGDADELSDDEFSEFGVTATATATLPADDDDDDDDEFAEVCSQFCSCCSLASAALLVLLCHTHFPAD